MPLLAVAFTASPVGAVGTGVTRKDCVPWVAAAYVALPAWSAWTVHVPAAT